MSGTQLLLDREDQGATLLPQNKYLGSKVVAHPAPHHFVVLSHSQCFKAVVLRVDRMRTAWPMSSSLAGFHSLHSFKAELLIVSFRAGAAFGRNRSKLDLASI